MDTIMKNNNNISNYEKYNKVYRMNDDKRNLWNENNRIAMYNKYHFDEKYREEKKEKRRILYKKRKEEEKLNKQN
jgi:hypothetical protein